MISQIAKRIKLLEDEIRRMSKTHRKMQDDMELLIKKNVRRASMPMLRKLEKSTSELEKAIGDRDDQPSKGTI